MTTTRGSKRRATWRHTVVRVAIGIAVVTAVIASGGCGASRQRAVSRRPAVVVERHAGACWPSALTQIDNPSTCRVQLVARDQAGQTVKASGWIEVGGAQPRFDLPGRFDWVVLEVDPGCAGTTGTVRYQTAAPVCEGPGDGAGVAAR